jgi:hypothetical protein
MRRKFTQEDFVKKSNLIHNNKYDYSKVIYKGSNVEVCIICPEHGEFWQRAIVHSHGGGCPLCARQKNAEKLCLTTKEFIEKAQLVHGNKYDYSKVEYKRNDKKVCIICPEHGEFWMTPGNHLNGQGCRKCDVVNRTKTTEDFINDAKKIYGDKYDYSKVEYKGNKKKVCIICPEYGEFWITPNNFLRGHNCNGKHTYKLTTKEFIKRVKKIHKNKYDYSKTEYKTIDEKVCIICPEHGEFWQRASGHLSGDGCPKCSPSSLKDNEYFIKKAKEVHNDRYDYSKVEYKGNKKKVCIICPEHGEFWQAPSTHLQGCGCPICNNSRLELEIFNTLKENNILFNVQKTFRWLKDKKNMFLDFYLPDYNVAIECQGTQHFEKNHFFGDIKGLISTQYRDYIKFSKCKNKSIKILYYIPYDYEKYENEFYNDKICFKDSNNLINILKDGKV